jgi:CRISPR-associated protein Cmr6
MNQKVNSRRSPSEVWQEFIQAELKSGSKLGKSFEKAGFGGYEAQIITLYFSDETLAKAARGQSDKLKDKLPVTFKPCSRINCQVGDVPVSAARQPLGITTPSKFGNPLQALNYTEFGDDGKGGQLSQPVLLAAVKAEKTCDLIYSKLKARTEMLASDTLSVSFNWRLRVGGTRGFRELLLPVFHPVFGVPYIPAASLKGAARAWARQNGELQLEISQILGILEGKIAKAAKVEFLDAFPTRACMSVDVATPQWHWHSDKVTYKPEPHPLLSLEQPTFTIGLRGTKPEHEKYVAIVKEWLDNALKSGIGSRVSGGYGRALGQPQASQYSHSYEFELWTQGMYGSEPPTKENRWQGVPEFRPTAIRGILRYWFRAMALGLYSAQNTQILEEELFGALSKQGKFSIGVIFNPSNFKDPYKYTGKIHLEATDRHQLNLLSKLLILAAHLGGVGRGSRRPLHLLNSRMRGCHWSIEDDNLPLSMNAERWQEFFQALQSAFAAVRSPLGNFNSSPGEPKKRQQDALDSNAQVWLLPSAAQIPPERVTNWQQNGQDRLVRGSALTLLYGNEKFKGESKDRERQVITGNSKVGGALETPSFIWIKSIFPHQELPYQVVTIFGVNSSDRMAFANALKKEGGTLVFGRMPSNNVPTKPNRPIPR